MWFKSPQIETSDARLLKLTKQGNSETYGQLYEKYVERIYRYIVFKVNTTQEAEDLTQETFIKAYDKINTFKSGSFQAWLYQIARNTIIDYWRKNSRVIKGAEIEYIESETDGEDQLIKQIDTKTEINRLKDAVTKLPEPYQEVISLRYLSDLSIADIAQIVKKDETWVRVTTHRAKEKLKLLLK